MFGRSEAANTRYVGNTASVVFTLCGNTGNPHSRKT